jgi:hypothetical protein
MRTLKLLVKNACSDFVKYWWFFAGVIGAVALDAWLGATLIAHGT